MLRVAQNLPDDDGGVEPRQKREDNVGLGSRGHVGLWEKQTYCTGIRLVLTLSGLDIPSR